MPKMKAGGIPVPPLTDKMWREALANSRPAGPFDAVRARYVKNKDRLELSLRNGIQVSFPRTQIWELKTARPAQLSRIQVLPGGDLISIRAIDVDISVPGLLADELGGIFAKAIGRKARGRTSPKKAAASRRNGRRGGRPKAAA